MGTSKEAKACDDLDPCVRVELASGNDGRAWRVRFSARAGSDGVAWAGATSLYVRTSVGVLKGSGSSTSARTSDATEIGRVRSSRVSCRPMADC